MEIKSAKAGRESVQVRIATVRSMEPALLLEVMRHRYQLYHGKQLISANEAGDGGETGDGDDDSSMEVNEWLRRVLELEFGGEKEVPDRLDPGRHRLDCDRYDFLPGCRHLLSTLGDRLLSYLRIICEDEGLTIPAREIYGAEMACIDGIADGEAVAEISRYVLPGGFASATDSRTRGKVVDMHRRLGLRLFTVVDRFAAKQGIRHLFAQVHPAHGAYYVSQGIFEKRGGEKPCPGVNNAPAVLMYRRVPET